LLKANCISGVSIGFDPTRSEPLDPRQPKNGQRVLQCELMEISLVSIPADRQAVITERAWRARGYLGQVPMSRGARLLEAEAAAPRQQRALTVAQLMQKERPVWTGGSVAGWTSEMRNYLERDTLRRAAAYYDDVAAWDYRRRQADLAALRRLA
jgi:hypothetical protein